MQCSRSSVWVVFVLLMFRRLRSLYSCHFYYVYSSTTTSASAAIACSDAFVAPFLQFRFRPQPSICFDAHTLACTHARTHAHTVSFATKRSDLNMTGDGFSIQVQPITNRPAHTRESPVRSRCGRKGKERDVTMQQSIYGTTAATTETGASVS